MEHDFITGILYLKRRHGGGADTEGSGAVISASLDRTAVYSYWAPPAEGSTERPKDPLTLPQLSGVCRAVERNDSLK